MSNIEEIQKLLNEKADVQAKISVSTFDGSIEVKTVNNQKYIFLFALIFYLFYLL